MMTERFNQNSRKKTRGGGKRRVQIIVPVVQLIETPGKCIQGSTEKSKQEVDSHQHRERLIKVRKGQSEPAGEGLTENELGENVSQQSRKSSQGVGGWGGCWVTLPKLKSQQIKTEKESKCHFRDPTNRKKEKPETVLSRWGGWVLMWAEWSRC